MCGDSQQDHCKNGKAAIIQENIAISADHIAIAKNSCIKKALFFLCFLLGVLIKGSHEDRILGMTFHTEFNGIFFGQHLVCNQQCIADPGVAFDAPHALKVQALVWKPLMLVQHIKNKTVGEQSKTPFVGVASQAYLIIVTDCF